MSISPAKENKPFCHSSRVPFVDIAPRPSRECEAKPDEPVETGR